MLLVPMLLLSCSLELQGDGPYLQRAAGELAAELVQSLGQCPRARNSIDHLSPLVVPAVQGDARGDLRGSLQAAMSATFSVSFAPEPPELGDIQERFFLLEGEKDLFEYIKEEGLFQDSRGLLVARVRTAPAAAGRMVTAEAALLDLEQGVYLWSGAAQRVVLDPTRPVSEIPDEILVDLVDRQVPMLAADRMAVREHLARLEDARAREALRRDEERFAYEEAVRQERERRVAVQKYGLLAFGIIVGALLLATQLRIRRIRIQATQLGGTALARREARERDRNLVAEGARRVRSLLAMIHNSGAKATPETRDAMERLVPDLEELARDLEGAPTGSFHGPVERKAARDESLAGLRSLEAHDRAVLGMIEEVDLAVSSMARLAESRAEVPEVMVQEAQALAARLRRRLGERAALIRAGRA